MKKILTLLTAGILIGCAHYYYVPNVQNVPLFKQKNEYRLSVISGFGESSFSKEIEAAYSITNHFGVMANFISAKDLENDEYSWGKGNYIEGAAGYFKPFGKSKVFEIYGGFGGSKQNHQYRPELIDTIYNAGTSELSFTRLFLQPSIGLTFSIFDIAFSTRMCWLSFNNANNQIDRKLNEQEFDKFNSLVNDKNFIFFEPALTIRGGWKYVKVQLQGEIDSYFNNGKNYFDDFHVSIGLFAAISARKHSSRNLKIQ
jgi:hypothetical protein